VTYRLLVTGSQTWNDPDLLAFILHSILRAHPDLLVVHGDAPRTEDGTGADSMTRAWCVINSVPEERHKAEWRPGGVYQWDAGFKRNEVMVDLGADSCVSFMMPCRKATCTWKREHTTHGTSHTMTLAKVAGIPVQEIEPLVRSEEE